MIIYISYRICLCIDQLKYFKGQGLIRKSVKFGKRLNQVTTNVEAILNYINETTSITHVYATTKFGNLNHLKNLWLSIQNQARDGVNFGCILTPSGRRIPKFYGLNITATMARYWIWANFTNKPYEPFQFENGYTHLDHTWLIQCGVNPNQF